MKFQMLAILVLLSLGCEKRTAKEREQEHLESLVKKEREQEHLESLVNPCADTLIFFEHRASGLCFSACETAYPYKKSPIGMGVVDCYKVRESEFFMGKR